MIAHNARLQVSGWRSTDDWKASGMGRYSWARFRSVAPAVLVEVEPLAHALPRLHDHVTPEAVRLRRPFRRPRRLPLARARSERRYQCSVCRSALLEESQIPLASADSQHRDSCQRHGGKKTAERKRACGARQLIGIFGLCSGGASGISSLPIILWQRWLLWRACKHIGLYWRRQGTEGLDIYFKEAKVVADLAPTSRSSGRRIELRFLPCTGNRHTLPHEWFEIPFAGSRQFVGFATGGRGAIPECPVCTAGRMNQHVLIAQPATEAEEASFS